MSAAAAAAAAGPLRPTAGGSAPTAPAAPRRARPSLPGAGEAEGGGWGGGRAAPRIPPLPPLPALELPGLMARVAFFFPLLSAMKIRGRSLAPPSLASPRRCSPSSSSSFSSFSSSSSSSAGAGVSQSHQLPGQAGREMPGSFRECQIKTSPERERDGGRDGERKQKVGGV